MEKSARLSPCPAIGCPSWHWRCLRQLLPCNQHEGGSSIRTLSTASLFGTYVVRLFRVSDTFVLMSEKVSHGSQSCSTTYLILAACFEARLHLRRCKFARDVLGSGIRVGRKTYLLVSAG